MSTMTIMTMTVFMDIEIKTKQSKHIFHMVLLFRFIVNNFLIINFRFFFCQKKLKNTILSFFTGLI